MLACKVLNRNIVVTSILLRFAFVSLGFYHIFTYMLRIHLFFPGMAIETLLLPEISFIVVGLSQLQTCGKKTCLFAFFFFPREDKL